MIKCQVDNATHYLRTDIVTPIPQWKLSLMAEIMESLCDQMTVELNVFREAVGGWVSNTIDPESCLYRSTIFFPSLEAAQSARRRLLNNPRLARVFPLQRLLHESPISPSSVTPTLSEADW